MGFNFMGLLMKAGKFIEQYEDVVSDIVMMLEKVNKPGMEKKKVAVKLIKLFLDEKLYDVPDFLDVVEEELIGIAIDLIVSKLRLQNKI